MKQTAWSQGKGLSETHFSHSIFNVKILTQSVNHATKGLLGVVHKKVLHLNAKSVFRQENNTCKITPHTLNRAIVTKVDCIFNHVNKSDTTSGSVIKIETT